MAPPSFKLLRPGCIYRVIYRSPIGGGTNPAPIIFPIYVGPAGSKVHALVLNHPRWTMSNTVHFVRFLRKMKNVPNVENFSGRLLYRILRSYFPNIVRHSYRTYFRIGLIRYALISSGYVPQDLLTDLEKELSDPNLYVQARSKLITRSILAFTGTGLDHDQMSKPRFYEPPTPAAPSAPPTTSSPAETETESELEGYE